MLMNANASDPVTATFGTNAPPPARSPTVRSPPVAYANVHTKIASTTWLGTSRRNVRSSRTENWLEAICRESTVSEKTMPVVVIIVADTTISTPRASPAVPWNITLSISEPGTTGMIDSRPPAARPTMMPSVGSTQ